MNYGLSKDTIDSINSVFADYSDVEQVVLYGSRAKGNYKNGSDIDLTVTGRELGIEHLTSISSDLDDLLLPYSFDLSLYDQITNNNLIDHINRIGIVFYNKK